MKLGAALVEGFAGDVPRRLEQLVTLPGVGRKTANVVLGNAFGIPGITVDTHFGRLSRRFGWTGSEDRWSSRRTSAALEKRDWTCSRSRVIFHGRRTCSPGGRRAAPARWPRSAPRTASGRRIRCGRPSSSRARPARSPRSISLPVPPPEASRGARAEFPGCRPLAGPARLVGPLSSMWPATARAEDISAFVPPPGHHRRSACSCCSARVRPAPTSCSPSARWACARTPARSPSRAGGSSPRTPAPARPPSARPGRRRASTPAGSWSWKPCPTSISR